MSLSNTYDSQNNVQMQSPSSQQLTQEIIVQNGVVSNKHLSYAQIRGVVQIFNHHFPKNGKRMSKDERKRRWLMYRNKIQQEYGRVITGKLESEKAYVKRYSRPLDFLKYKLKRSVNLKIEDLPNEADKEYYFEIGGLEDVQKLINNTYDVNYDSVQRITNNFENYNNNRSSSRRKRRRIEINENANDNAHNKNHNLSNQSNNNFLQPQIIINDAQINEISSVPPALSNNHPQRQKIERDYKVDEALINLSEKLDAFEQDVLDKKKIEIYEITKQRIVAIKNSMETYFINDPHLIGCIPAVENQESIAFDCWMNKYKHIIKDDKEIKGNFQLIIDQLCLLKSDMSDWTNFLTKWKLYRIFHQDNFRIVWHKIKKELNIQDHEKYVELTLMDDASVTADENDEEKQAD